MVHFGRDRFGRRSLVAHKSDYLKNNGILIDTISSVVLPPHELRLDFTKECLVRIGFN